MEYKGTKLNQTETGIMMFGTEKEKAELKAKIEEPTIFDEQEYERKQLHGNWKG